MNDSWIGSKTHRNTEHWTQLTEKRWNFRVEYFPRIHYIAACPRSPKAHEQNGNPNNSKDELSSCRCSIRSYGEIKTMKRNVLLIPHMCCVHIRKKISSRTLINPRTWIRDKVVIYLQRKTRRRMGQSR